MSNQYTVKSGRREAIYPKATKQAVEQLRGNFNSIKAMAKHFGVGERVFRNILRYSHPVTGHTVDKIREKIPGWCADLEPKVRRAQYKVERATADQRKGKPITDEGQLSVEGADGLKITALHEAIKRDKKATSDAAARMAKGADEPLPDVAKELTDLSAVFQRLSPQATYLLSRLIRFRSPTCDACPIVLDEIADALRNLGDVVPLFKQKV